MKTPLLIAVSALALAGCGRGASYAIAKLQCPAVEGDLTRVDVADGGRACTYRSPDGAEVALRLVEVKDNPQATLARIEADLRNSIHQGPADAAPAAHHDPATTRAALAEADEIQAQAAADSGGPVADADGADQTDIDLPGLKVSADSDKAKVRIGPVRIDADSHDATINVYREVRMRGEALATEKRGLRATFIHTGDDLPDGYRYVGYEAGGPKTGPLTVAQVRSKGDADTGDRIQHDVRELVRRNGGV